MQSLRLQRSFLVGPGSAPARHQNALSGRPAARPLLQQVAVRTSRRSTLVAPVRAAAQGATSGRSPDGGSSTALRLAQEEAFSLGHSKCGTEHLVLGLLREEGAASKLLKDAGVTLSGARAAAEELFGQGKRPASVDIGEDGQPVLPLGPDTKTVLSLAEQQGTLLISGCGGLHLLAALLSPVDDDSEYKGLQLLRALGVDLERLRKEVSDSKTPLTLGQERAPSASGSRDLFNLKTMPKDRAMLLRSLKSEQLHTAIRKAINPTADWRSKADELEVALKELGEILELTEGRASDPKLDQAEQQAVMKVGRLMRELSDAVGSRPKDNELSRPGSMRGINGEILGVRSRAELQYGIKCGRFLAATAKTPPSNASWRRKAAELEKAVMQAAVLEEMRIVIGVAEEVPPEDDPLSEPEEALLYKIFSLMEELQSAMGLTKDAGDEGSKISCAEMIAPIENLRVLVAAARRPGTPAGLRGKADKLEAAIEEACTLLEVNERKASKGVISALDDRNESQALQKVAELAAEVRAALDGFAGVLQPASAADPALQSDAARQQGRAKMPNPKAPQAAGQEQASSVGGSASSKEAQQQLKAVKRGQLQVVAWRNALSSSDAASRSKVAELETSMKELGKLMEIKGEDDGGALDQAVGLALMKVMKLTGEMKAATGLGGLPDDNSAYVYPQMWIVLFGMMPVATWEGMQKGIRLSQQFVEVARSPPSTDAWRSKAAELEAALMALYKEVEVSNEKFGLRDRAGEAETEALYKVAIIGEELRNALCISSDDEEEEGSQQLQEPPPERQPQQLSAGAPANHGGLTRSDMVESMQEACVQLKLNDTRESEGKLSAADELTERRTMQKVMQLATELRAVVVVDGNSPGATLPRAAGHSELHVAAERGDLKGVKAALAAGEDVNAPGSKGSTPLHCAARSGSVECIQALLAAGADLRARCKMGDHPTHWAAFGNRVEAVRALVAAGAPLEARNNFGSTPLHLAAQGSSLEAVKLLLSLGADVNARSKEDGITALHQAAQMGSPAVIEALLAGGADIAAVASAPAAEGITPLHCACMDGNVAAIRALTAAGADVLVKDQKCRRPLHVAAVQGGPDAVMALLAAGKAQEQLKARNGWGGTPLHAAAEEDQVDVIKVLVAAGADLEARNDYGLTPRQSALERGKQEAVRALMEAGKPRQ